MSNRLPLFTFRDFMNLLIYPLNHHNPKWKHPRQLRLLLILNMFYLYQCSVAQLWHFFNVQLPELQKLFNTWLYQSGGVITLSALFSLIIQRSVSWVLNDNIKSKSDRFLILHVHYFAFTDLTFQLQSASVIQHHEILLKISAVGACPF